MYRRAKRFSKVNGASKAPWLLFNPHTIGDVPKESRLVYTDMKEDDPDWIQVCAIDPATKNCAFRIERRSYDPKNGKEIKVETILQTKLNFLEASTDRTKQAITSIDPGESCAPYLYSIEKIAGMMSYLENCHYIIIESQMPINTEMVRMGQHLITSMMIMLRDRGVLPLIVEIDPKIKSNTFGAGRMKKPELKKWAVNKAIEILTENGDLSTAKFIEHSSKKDDHGDVVCYTTAWFKILADGGIVHSLPKCNVKPQIEKEKSEIHHPKEEAHHPLILQKNPTLAPTKKQKKGVTSLAHPPKIHHQ